VGRLLCFGPRGKKKKKTKTGWAGLERGLGEGWSDSLFSFFNSFFFISFSNFYSKPFQNF
jgi:hypothetical protein